jgi:hypothetical protein
MSDTKHTPGPWEFQTFLQRYVDGTVSTVSKKIVSPVLDQKTGAKHLLAEVHAQHENHEADGRLMAAAPELLEALDLLTKHIAQALYSGEIDLSAQEQIREANLIALDAIRKTKGEL